MYSHVVYIRNLCSCYIRKLTFSRHFFDAPLPVTNMINLRTPRRIDILGNISYKKRRPHPQTALTDGVFGWSFTTFSVRMDLRFCVIFVSKSCVTWIIKVDLCKELKLNHIVQFFKKYSTNKETVTIKRNGHRVLI